MCGSKNTRTINKTLLLYCTLLALIFTACNSAGDLDPYTSDKITEGHYRFDTYYKDTTHLNAFDLWIKTSGTAIIMYTDSAFQVPAYRGTFLRHDTTRLEYIPHPIVAYGILNDSVCEIRYMDFLHKGRKI